MRKALFLALFMALSAGYAAAQIGGPATGDYPRAEFFIGYTHERVGQRIESVTQPGQPGYFFDDRRRGMNGFSVEAVGNASRNVGIVGNISGTYDRNDFTAGAPAINRRVTASKYNFLVGPRVTARGDAFSPNRAQPFGHVMVGAAHFRNRVGATQAQAGVPAQAEFRQTHTGFAMAVGGGLDVRAGERVDVRVFQVDYLPTWGGPRGQFGTGNRRQDGVRFTFGVKFR